MTQKSAQFKKVSLNRAVLAKALGLNAGDIDRKLPSEFVSTGVFNLMVPLRNRKAPEKIHVNMRSLAQTIAPHATIAYCFVPNGQGKAFSRGMLPWGMWKDAATGSAAGSLRAYLTKHRKLEPRETLHILQGVEMGRPSEIQVSVRNERGRLVPRVSGSAVKILEAHIET